MFYASKNVVLGRSFVDELLAALSTRPAAAIVAAGKLRLSTAVGLVITPDTALSALTPNEANFSGYTAGGYAVTFVGPVQPGSNVEGVIVSQLITRSLGSPDVGNDVTGYWIDDGTRMVLGEAFPTPIDMSSPTGYLDLLVALAVGLFTTVAP